MAQKHKSASEDYVSIPRSEYERLLARAGEVPPLPEPDAQGNLPARQAIAVSLARDLIRHRRSLGLTQNELAQLAGVRPATVQRLEQAEHIPNVAAVAKIERALARAHTAKSGKNARRKKVR